MSNRLLKIAGMAAVLVSLAQGANANAIVNGDFAAGLTGWSSSGNVAAVPETAYASCCGTANAVPGVNVASFGSGNGPDNGVLSQTFATTVGQNYELTFGYGAIVGTGPQSLLVEVNLSALTLSAAIIDSTSTNDFNTVFSTYLYNFTADAALTTLSFTDTSAVTAGVDGVLRNVAVNAVNPVPEPMSLSLVGVGLAGIAAVRRRKRSKSA